MTLGEIRSKYLEFFKARGHAAIPSASLVPENDPTTLFTGSGMQPLVPYLLGENHPSGARLVDSQKCFRAMDIEEVGDNRHTTFFEMLGNWSLGDYFKEEQLPWLFEFLTDPIHGIGLDAHRLYVTVFAGDEKNNIPRDTESVEIWKKLFESKKITAKDVVIGSETDGYKKGMGDGRIFYYDATKNWWSRSGTPDKMPAGEPGGPDSEVFYDFGTPHDKKFGEHCHPNCDCGRFLEIGNSVFMQYIKKEDGSFALLPKQNVDFGGGLERLTAVSENNNDVFAVAYHNIIAYLERLSGKKYADDMRSFRIIADHVKAAIFLINDGVLPAKSDQGYFVRRLIRRAVRYADKLGIHENGFVELVEPIAEMYRDAYPDLFENVTAIGQILAREEEQFRKTLARGLKIFDELYQIHIRKTGQADEDMGALATKGLHASKIFELITTYGFPREVIEEIAKEKNLMIFWDQVEVLLKQHQELSRAGSEQKFKGGLADTGEQTVRLHTAHHLLLKALQMVLGDTVKQRGSNITAERLRIDFMYGQKMTDEQKREVEKIVNEKIKEDLPVIRSEMLHAEAEKLHAEHEFGQKYPERVSVYSVGPKNATAENPQYEKSFSLEFCGGPHATHTGELGHFKIQKEEAVAQGIRRIKAVLE